MVTSMFLIPLLLLTPFKSLTVVVPFIILQSSTNTYQAPQKTEIIKSNNYKSYKQYHLGKKFHLKTKDKDFNAKIVLSASFEYHTMHKKLNKELTKKLPKIRAIITLAITTKKFNELQSSIQKMAVAKEIKNKINQILTSGQISTVYFDEFLSQKKP